MGCTLVDSSLKYLTKMEMTDSVKHSSLFCDLAIIKAVNSFILNMKGCRQLHAKLVL
jgi:hypothetical protein